MNGGFGYLKNCHSPFTINYSQFIITLLWALISYP